MKCAIILPTYRERENLPELIDALVQTRLETLILVVDDNSPDGTGEIADRISASNSSVRVLHRASREGYGRALTAAFKHILVTMPDVDRVITMDADFSHQPRHLPAILEGLETSDLVVGSRYVRGGGVVNWSFHRRLLSRCGNSYVRAVTGMRVHDCTSGFVGYRRRVLESIDLDTLRAHGYSFLIELKLRAAQSGCSIAEVPIVFVERARGESKMNLRIALEALALVWKLRLGSTTASRR